MEKIEEINSVRSEIQEISSFRDTGYFDGKPRFFDS